MKKLILILFLVGIVLISACNNKIIKTTETPAKVPPSLNVYGKLVDLSVNNDLIIFKIQTEIVNWELNNTFLEVNIDASAFREYYRDITDYSKKFYDYKEENVALRGWYSSVNNYYIFDIDKLEPKTFYYFNFRGYEQNGISVTDGVFGQFVNYNQDKNSMDIYTIWNNEEGLTTIYLTSNKQFEWEEEDMGNRIVPRNSEFISAQRPWRPSDLTKGNNYIFYFMKLSEKEGPWEKVVISENLTEYKEGGRWLHEDDLLRDQMITTESETGGELQPGQMRAVRTFSTSIIPSEEREINIKLTNKQDVEISYKISNVKIVDEILWEPDLRQCRENEQEYQEIIVPGPVGGETKKVLAKVCSIKDSGQRLQESVLSNCQINYDSSENILSGDLSKIVTFQVLCKEPVSCRTWYISEMYGNVTIECSLILLGDLEFRDELENIHKKDNFYLRQMLTLSQKASANVDYSKEISSKDEFYIYVDYKDVDGNQIENAQILLQFKNLGVSGIFTLRYDEILDRYKFRWSDFVEWDPSYKKGNYQFTITTIKAGYQTIQLGPYDFVLK